MFRFEPGKFFSESAVLPQQLLFLSHELFFLTVQLFFFPVEPAIVCCQFSTLLFF